MNKKSLIILALPAILLTGCKQNGKGPSDEYDGTNPLLIEPISELCKGFKAKGTLTETRDYYLDEEHLAPADIESKVIRTQAVLTYTNDKEYEGFDYKFNRINDDETLTYISADNMYNEQGYLAFNEVDYDNVVRDGFFAIDGDENKVPYSSNGGINPFELIQAPEFVKNGSNYSLSRSKATVMFNLFFNFIDAIPTNTNVKSNTFVFDEDYNLNSIAFDLFDYYSVETIHDVQYENYYVSSHYSAEFTISEIGTAKAQNEIKAEPEKHYDDLAHALNKLATTPSYRVNRHYDPVSNGEEIEQEETIDVYYDSPKQAIYQAVYSGGPQQRPNTINGGDALYVDTNKDGKLNAFMYQEKTPGTGDFTWLPTPDLGNLNDNFAYDEYTLNNVGFVNPNIFDLNEDGSYSPIPAHRQYIVCDIFTPFIAPVSDISGGYATDVKLYLTESKSSIDKIVCTSSMSGIDAVTTIRFDQWGTAKIPFDALNNINK